MNIAPDEHVQPQLMFDYDGKRDRWNGYNPEEHMKIVEEYSKVDLVRRCCDLLGTVLVFGGAGLGAGTLVMCSVDIRAGAEKKYLNKCIFMLHRPNVH